MYEPIEPSWRRPRIGGAVPLPTGPEDGVAVPTPPSPPKRKGILDRILGRLLPMPEGLLNDEEMSGARQQGLLSLGLGLLDAAGPSPTPVSMGQALARSLPGAQQNMQSYAGGIVAQRQQQERQALFARYQPMLEQAGQNVAAALPILTQMMTEMLRMGDTEGAGKLSEVIKSMGGAQAGTRPVALPGSSRLVGPNGEILQDIDPRAIGGASGGALRPIIVRGQDGKPEIMLFDPKTGTFIPTGRRPGSMRGLTEVQAKMRAHLEMVQPAIEILDMADAPPNRWAQFARQRGLGETITARDQLMDVASRQVAEAFLRMTTGAAYNAEELASALTINTPRAGDTPVTRAYKKKVRARLLSALKILASGEYSEPSELDAAHAEIDAIMQDAGVAPDSTEGDITPPWERP